ncbi:sensor histidine kinase, partial [Porticoccus sp.]|uniref:sensor histidine kinase n=1 Tax=Porticoccus sp. TaxID=2024853 RepID=UPI003F697069
TLKQQEDQLTTQRENQLRDEQLLAIGSLAAGTAHELGTPLNTMKIVVDEMVADPSNPDDDLKILQQQIEQCRLTLKQLVATAEGTLDGGEKIDLRHYFDKLFERWQLMRPRVQANIRYPDNLPDIHTRLHPTIAQSLTSLLNNAADASPDQIDVEVSWDSQQVELCIKDYGDGVAPQLQSRLGSAFTSNKPEGMGLGLFLTQATLQRYGGTVTMKPGADSGNMTRVVLPLQGNHAG